VDSSGSAYVTGRTNSADFPVTAGAFQQVFGGGTGCTVFPCPDAFIAKLDSAGALVYATFLGGNFEDRANAIAVDTAGSAYVTGATGSANFPITAGAYQASFGTGGAFVTKLDPAGAAAEYSAYLGGSANGMGIAVDSGGSAHVTGTAAQSASESIPIVNAFQATFGGFLADAFVTKLNPAGADLVYSSYLGGWGEDAGLAIALDNAGNAYVTGRTYAADFPRTRPFQPLKGDRTGDLLNDVFVARISDNAPAVANLALTMTGTPGTVAECETVEYELSLTNAGPSSATNVLVSNVPDPIARVDAASPTQGRCTIGNTVICNVGTIASGASVTIRIAVTMRDTTLEPGFVQTAVNRASVASDLPDPLVDDNAAVAVTTVTPATCSIDGGGGGGGGALDGASLLALWFAGWRRRRRHRRVNP